MMESTRPAVSAGTRRSPLVLAVVAALAIGTAGSARADDAADIQALKQQMAEMQRKLDAIVQRQNAPAPAPVASAAAAVPAPSSPMSAPTPPVSGTFYAGPVAVTLGGFVEMMVVNRSRNEAADWASNYNGSITFPQSPNNHLSEFHLTERQSRWQALAQGPSDPDVAAEAYLEGDFGAAPSNGNNNETASFAPRVRHFYADYQRKDQGWYLLFGQTWSLLTQNRTLIAPRTENPTITIDGQYVPGFNWTRVSQIRLVKNFGNTVAFGVSVENPAMLLTASTTAPAAYLTANSYAPFYTSAPAGSGFAPTVSITTDQLPDVIAKVAFDPGWGHYELFGMVRSFRDRNPEIKGAAASNNTTTASSGGGSVLLPLVPKVLEFTGSVLVGSGVGRYGSAQLPDATLSSDGSIAAIKGYSYLAGLIWNPAPSLRLYVYGGREHDDKTDFMVTVPAAGAVPASTYGFGYGSPLFNDANCLIEGTADGCSAHTSTITQATIGGWWKFYQGALGNMQFGLQFTNVKREIYAGVGPQVNGLAGPLVNPSTSINIGLLSFRYYPYQK